MSYRMTCYHPSGEVFQSAEMHLLEIGRIAGIFEWLGTRCQLYKSYDGETWRLLRFRFSGRQAQMEKPDGHQ